MNKNLNVSEGRKEKKRMLPISNNKYSDFLNTRTSFGFLPQILQLSRISDFSSTIIDNIYSNNPEQDSYGGNILIKFTDHFSQILSVNKLIAKIKPKSIYKRDFANFDEVSFIFYFIYFIYSLF